MGSIEQLSAERAPDEEGKRLTFKLQNIPIMNTGLMTSRQR